MATLLALCGAGWRRRLAGGAATILLLPLVFAAAGTQSRQVVPISLAVMSLYRDGNMPQPVWPRRRWRYAFAALGIAFHLSPTFVIEIGRLDYTAVFLYLAFLFPIDARPSRPPT